MLLPMINTSIALLFSTLIILLTTLLAARSALNREKSSPFECGFDPKNKARLPFSMRFFLLAVIFLVFDIEIALLLPWPLASFYKHPVSTLTSTTAFLIILLLGLLHEWNEGSLEWSK